LRKYSNKLLASSQQATATDPTCDKSGSLLPSHTHGTNMNGRQPGKIHAELSAEKINMGVKRLSQLGKSLEEMEVSGCMRQLTFLLFHFLRTFNNCHKYLGSS
jgi:hypothetical protein